MIDTLEAIQLQQSELDRFYGQPWFVSYSALKKLLYHPPLFYDWYIRRQRPDKTEAHLINGSAIHCLLLNNGSFESQFLVSPTVVPSDNAMKIVRHIFSLYLKNQVYFDSCGKNCLKDFTTEILEWLVVNNLHQSNVSDTVLKKGQTDLLTGDQKRLAKILTTENMDYFEYMKIKGTRDIIDLEALNNCRRAVQIIREDDRVMELLGMNVSDFDNIDVHNELHLQAPLEHFDFGIAGVLDNHTVNHDLKKIIINDIKNIDRLLADFKATIAFYNYDWQAAIYYRLVMHMYRNLIRDLGYSVEFNFVVVDKEMQIYVFPVTTLTFASWFTDLDRQLEKARYHYQERSYRLPYEFALGLVEI